MTAATKEPATANPAHVFGVGLLKASPAEMSVVVVPMGGHDGQLDRERRILDLTDLAAEIRERVAGEPGYKEYAAAKAKMAAHIAAADQKIRECREVLAAAEKLRAVEQLDLDTSDYGGRLAHADAKIFAAKVALTDAQRGRAAIDPVLGILRPAAERAALRVAVAVFEERAVELGERQQQALASVAGVAGRAFDELLVTARAVKGMESVDAGEFAKSMANVLM